MIALLDGDLIAYRCAASCQKQGVVTEDIGIAQARANNLLVNILKEVGSQDPHVFLSGGENFRKKINPQYKANRVDQERPVYLEPLREWLAVEWHASITDGIEADDALGIFQTKYTEQDVPSIICSLDKDLLQIPGNHYSWEIGTEKWTRPARKILVSPQEGLFNFYWQIMMGDTADNVGGFDGKMRQKVPKFMEPWKEELSSLDEELFMFHFVYEHYKEDLNRMLINGQCLYVLRHEEDNWLKNVQPLMEALGLKDATEPS